MKHLLNQLVVISNEGNHIITTVNHFDEHRIYTGSVVKDRQVIHSDSVLQRDKICTIHLANAAETNLFLDTLYLHYLNAIKDETTNTP